MTGELIVAVMPLSALVGFLFWGWSRFMAGVDRILYEQVQNDAWPQEP